jgi:hypothetical protein
MLANGEKIKQILYSEIENIGKEKIQAKINSSIESSQKYIDKIMSECITKLTYESNDDDDDDDYNITIATLCEVLLHFMLTICTLPSERKIRVKNDLILDVIIPNLQSLKIKPDKSIIIQVIKDKMMDLNKIPELEFLQPNHENIWLISATPLSATKYTTYTVFPNSGLHNYSNIIIDIDNFLKETEDKSFRFIH